MDLRKLSLRNARVGSKPFDRLALEHSLSVFALEREDHMESALRPAEDGDPVRAALSSGRALLRQ